MWPAASRISASIYRSDGAACLKRVRLWAAFGAVARTRVADIVVDSPFIRVLRDTMGSPSPEELLTPPTGSNDAGARYRRSFAKALPIAWARYLAEFDPSYHQRQARWHSLRFAGVCPLAPEWFGATPEFDVVEAC